VIVRRLIAQLRRASDVLYRALLLLLLTLVYVAVIPWYALALRLRRRPSAVWRPRSDPAVGSLERLRSPF
jgi:hypothetical protein